MSDLIDRQAAIEAVKDWIRSEEFRWSNATYYMEKRIKKLPSAEPERKTGKWIEYTKVIIPEPYNHWEQAWKCSECGYDDGFVAWNYCPNCGAKMREDNDA